MNYIVIYLICPSFLTDAGPHLLGSCPTHLDPICVLRNDKSRSIHRPTTTAYVLHPVLKTQIRYRGIVFRIGLGLQCSSKSAAE